MAATTTEAPPFDTHAVAVELEREFTPGQAGAVTEAIKTATGGLATKADLKALEERIKTEINEVKTEIHKTASAQTWRYVMYVGVLMAILRYVPVGCSIAPP